MKTIYLLDVTKKYCHKQNSSQFGLQRDKKRIVGAFEDRDSAKSFISNAIESDLENLSSVMQGDASRFVTHYLHYIDDENNLDFLRKMLAKDYFVTSVNLYN